MAPVVAATSTSWFADSSVPATESIDVADVRSYYANGESEAAVEPSTPAAFREPLESESSGSHQAAAKPQTADGAKFQSADGTWGDDLDIPDFLR